MGRLHAAESRRAFLRDGQAVPPALAPDEHDARPRPRGRVQVTVDLASLSAATGAVTPAAFRMKMLAICFSLFLLGGGCGREHVSLSLL